MPTEIASNEARVNVTYADRNGDLPDPVSFDSTEEEVRAWVTEAVRGGGVPGLPADPRADFTNYKVDRFAADAVCPVNRLMIRPKTPLGA